MDTKTKDVKSYPKSPNYLLSVLTNKCPKCRKGRIYKTDNPYNLKTFLDMHKNCHYCGQPTEIEVGFYYGTGYVSYALSVAFLVTTFVIWKTIFGLSFEDFSVFWWLIASCALLVLLQPLLMRLSRSLWLSCFVKYDAHANKISLN